MKHFGDITKISGFDAPIVDVIVGGSPCQDLSIAGKRAGLDGERSGLFMEQIRIIKEMRENDRRNGRAAHDVRPRYMVWENVPGAFSSNKGEDFRIVLEETAKVAYEDAVVPMPNKGKWSNAGCIVGDGWSIAWRILDAQFWGVPQRRRRIALVADFGGQSAPEILFVSKSMSRNIEPSKPKGEETSHDASSGFRADDRDGCGFDGYNGTLTGQVSATLGVNCGMTTGRNGVIEREHDAFSLNWQAAVGAGICVERELSSPLACTRLPAVAVPYTSKFGSGCECYSKSRRAQTATDCETWKESDTANTLNAFDVGEVRATELVVCVDKGGGKSQCNVTEGKTPTLTCTHGGEPAVAYAQLAYDKYEDADIGTTLKAMGGNYGGGTENLVVCAISGDKAGTLDSSYYKGCGMRSGVEREVVAVAVDARNGTESETNGALQSNSAHSLNGNNVVRVRYIVRRLTPIECERLQGFPDGWTDIGDYADTNGKNKKASDSARYKALGNSIAIPPWKWVMKRISACYERDATLASLFDGIGGFPYIWEQINGKGTCLWASEIEEFCIAVTKRRIG